MVIMMRSIGYKISEINIYIYIYIYIYIRVVDCGQQPS